MAWKSYAGTYLFLLLQDRYADYMSINIPLINSRTPTSPTAFDCTAFHVQECFSRLLLMAYEKSH